MTRPKRVTPVSVKISFSASTDVHAGMPVASVMRWHRRSSASKPSQPDDVPFQPMHVELGMRQQFRRAQDLAVVELAERASGRARSR